MAWFTYKAIDPSGVVFTGDMEASNAAQVIDRLLDQGHTPLHTEERRSDTRGALLSWRRKLSSKELTLLTVQLASLLDAGLTLEQALETLQQSANTGPIPRLVGALLNDVREGASLSAAMSRYPSAFPADYVGLVAAGENGGALSVVLERLANNLERTQDVKDKVVSALIYPALLLGMILTALIVIVTFVLPQFEPLFAQAGADIPPMTQLVLDIGRFVKSNGIALGLGTLAAIIGSFLLAQTPPVKFAIHKSLLSPGALFGIGQKIEGAQFARSLGLLIGNGLTLARAVEITKDTTGNVAITASLEELSNAIREGGALSRWLNSAGVFPPLLAQLVQVGERTGRLRDMLDKAAVLFERDIEKTIDRALALLVPLLTLIMGGIVAFFVGAVMMGLTSINQIAL